MQTDQILEQFSRVTFKLPKAALKAARADRAQLAPMFIDAFERFAENESADEATANALFFKFHLLAEWRETAAYRPLCRFLRCAPDRLDAVLGDVTTTAHRVISAVFDGDPQPIFDVILDPNADEFVRWNLCEMLARLVLEGRLDRAIVANFLRDCFSHMQPQRSCHVWDGWAFAVAKLGLVEFRAILETVYTRGYADSGVARFSEVEADLVAASDPAQQALWLNDRDDGPFTDVIAEMSGWYCFSKEAERAHNRSQSSALAKGTPVAAVGKLAGRNEPCPCGSGKKYKKCCLN